MGPYFWIFVFFPKLQSHFIPSTFSIKVRYPVKMLTTEQKQGKKKKKKSWYWIREVKIKQQQYCTITTSIINITNNYNISLEFIFTKFLVWIMKDLVLNNLPTWFLQCAQFIKFTVILVLQSREKVRLVKVIITDH